MRLRRLIGTLAERTARGEFRPYDASFNKMADRALEAEARVKELTELRPMSEAPRDGREILVKWPDEDEWDVVWADAGGNWTRGCHGCEPIDAEFVGWLPLPEESSE